MPPLDAERAAEIAALLVAAGGEDVAFVRQRDEVFFARGRDAVRTAATVLIQGVYATWPRDAHFILRNAIHVTRAPGPFALGMVKVAARRVREVAPRASGAAVPFAMREVSFEPEPLPAVAVPPSGLSASEWLAFARGLVAPPREDRPRFARDRRVGAALVAPDGTLLAASANTNGANRTRHAELNVLLEHWRSTGRRLLPGASLHATLRPCKMCAGLLWELSEEPGTVLVHYAEDDPGPAARNTVLCPGSEMRERFARTPRELAAPGCVLVEPVVSSRRIDELRGGGG